MIQYRAYVKDQLALNTLPVAFMNVDSFTIRRDLLETANSTFEVDNVPTNINNGDIFVLYSPKGTTMYYGVITSINENTIDCSQMTSFYDIEAPNYYPGTLPNNIEGEYRDFYKYVCDGNIVGASYIDTLLKQEKETLKLVAGTTTSGNYYSEDAFINLEQGIYDLFKNKGIVFDFYIPYGTWTVGSDYGGLVTIKKPSNSPIKIGSNAQCIQDISPTTEYQETNKLIIYGNDWSYRGTYIATTNGIVSEPTSIVNRFGVIKTKIVQSDEELTEVVNTNLTDAIYNHQIEFTLMLDNKLYNFNDWELGQPLHIYQDGKFFNSIFTGYEMVKNSNEEPNSVRVICGKVRNTLTSVLKKVVKIV